jgi:DNA-binding transcriptional LysR family regulator
MDVNFELYKVFYYVAQNLSFSSAAEKLFISQSAISQSIKVLEEKMNCHLFFRNTKSVKLTHEGEILFKYIEQAFNFIKLGEQNITEINSLNMGEIKIGATDTICKYYLLPYLKSFNKAYPNIKIKITNSTSPKCVELLNNGLVDFSLVNLPIENTKNIKVTELRPINDVFIAGKNFINLKGKEISIKELKNHPVLALEKNTVSRKFLDDFLNSYGVDITPEIELGSIDLLVELAKIGMGVSFVMHDCAKSSIDNDELFVLNIKEEIPKRYLGIITHNNIPLSVAAVRFIESLR